MFKEIFDLDPKEVEEFITNLVRENHKRGLESEEYEQWLKDYEIQVRWHPTYGVDGYTRGDDEQDYLSIM